MRRRKGTIASHSVIKSYFRPQNLTTDRTVITRRMILTCIVGFSATALVHINAFALSSPYNVTAEASSAIVTDAGIPAEQTFTEVVSGDTFLPIAGASDIIDVATDEVMEIADVTIEKYESAKMYNTEYEMYRSDETIAVYNHVDKSEPTTVVTPNNATPVLASVNTQPAPEQISATMEIPVGDTVVMAEAVPIYKQGVMGNGAYGSITDACWVTGAAEYIANGTLPDPSLEPSAKTGTGTLTKSSGVNFGPSGRETYYNLNMNGIVRMARNAGLSEEEYPYWIREDGVKMLGPYIICACHLGLRPRYSTVQTSLGLALVCDTGGFASTKPYGIDIATNW